MSANDAATVEKSRNGRLQEARRQWLGLDPVRDDASAIANELRDIQGTFQSIYDAKSETDDETNNMAGERLALLLLQSGDDKASRKADAILKDLGFTCRLSRQVLVYNNNNNIQGTMQHAKDSAKTNRISTTSTMIPVSTCDGFLSDSQMHAMQQIFLDPNAPYWTTHDYQVEPPSPYYSFVLPLDSPLLSPNTLLGSILQKILDQVATFQPAAVKQAHFIELWAHNRPIATGHQLHFDSDNEGDAGSSIRHPLTTSILYLTSHGGPTVVTNQRLASRLAASKAWLVPAQSNRVVHMDGRVLHCVAPGNVVRMDAIAGAATGGVHGNAIMKNDSDTGDSPCRRVSVMIALWRSIRIRDETPQGAARPFPGDASWAKALTAPLAACNGDDGEECTLVALKHVFERVADGQPWSRDDGMPDYDQIFQGI